MAAAGPSDGLQVPQPDKGPLGADQVWVHWRRMVRSAYGVLGDRDQAVESAAEALAEVLAKPPSNVRNAEAFLVTVAKRRAIDHLRAFSSDRRRMHVVGRAQDRCEVDVAEAVADQHEAVWVDATARRLLPALSYELLCLVADGVDIGTAARQLGMTLRGAESRLLRARQIMRSALAQTLAGLAALGAGLRKLLGTASAGAAAATLAALIMLVPSVDGSAPRSPDPIVESPDADARRLPAAVPSTATSHLPETRAPSSVSGGGVAGPATSPTPQLRTPLGGVGTYDTDDGYQPTDPIDLMRHCLENLRIEPHYQGCEGAATSPSAPPSR